MLLFAFLFGYTIAVSAVADEAESIVSVAKTPPYKLCSLSMWQLTVDGEVFECQMYNIDGYNYCKLRDLAMALRNTSCEFSVSWDKDKHLVTAMSEEKYIPVGGEGILSVDKSATCVPSQHAALFNGTVSDAFCYNIGDNNFFKLRDLAPIFKFGVDYDSDSFTAIVYTKPVTLPTDSEMIFQDAIIFSGEEVALNGLHQSEHLSAGTESHDSVRNNDPSLSEAAPAITSSLGNPEKSYTIKFYDQDGITELVSRNGVELNGYAAPPIPSSKNGVDFLGWNGRYAAVNADTSVRAVYSDESNVFAFSDTSYLSGDTVTVFLSISGKVDFCGFDINIMYDADLTLISCNDELDIDIVSNFHAYSNGILLNYSGTRNINKKSNIIQMKFKVNNTQKKALPLWVTVNSIYKIDLYEPVVAQYTTLDSAILVS